MPRAGALAAFAAAYAHGDAIASPMPARPPDRLTLVAAAPASTMQGNATVSPPAFMRHLTIGLSWFAVVLVLAAYLPGHIKAKTKHPMLAGIKIWAFAHLLSNGDLGSIILFGSFLAWAVYARIAAKKREALGDITRVGMADRGWANDAIAVGLGTVLYLALAYVFHPAVIGVPVFRA